MEKEELLQAFGNRVRHFRKHEGMTQNQLAEAAELTVEQISKVERGLSRTRIETAQRMATALDVELHELFVLGKTKPVNPILLSIIDELDGQEDQTLNYILQLIKGLEKVRG